MKKFDIFYFSSTHWDREWYQDFQGFRYRLVKLVNKLLGILDNDPEFKTFHFDGQSIVLEDYAEIEPQKVEKLKKYIAERKILIGPWYVMPDEFILSGESLIRNLMIGHKTCKEWGAEPWKYGYICDIFGHTAQMPQIFRGFDIKYSLLGRGMTEGDPAYFRWQAPDGSECLNFNLNPDHGYGQYAYTYRYEADKTANNPTIVENIKKYIDLELERSAQPIIILMDGLDHFEPLEETSEHLKIIAELYPEATIHHVDLTKQGEMLEQYVDELPVIKGELNKTAQFGHSFLHLITNTLSSHYPIKQQNDQCQNLLEKYLEPICAMAAMEGIELNHRFVEIAYKSLIQNHPHDSICGCSIDQVHKDMTSRFDKTKEIANVLSGDYFNQTVKGAESGLDGKHEYVLTIHNSLPYELDKTVTVDLEFRPDFAFKFSEPFGYQPINSFKIIDCEGNEIPYKLISIKRNATKRYYNSPAGYSTDIHTVTFRTKLPSCGKAEFKVVSGGGPVRYFDQLVSGENFAENDYIRLDIMQNGALKLTDKKTGKVYSNLGNLVSDGEIGDGWYHANPIDDYAVSTIGGACQITKLENGPSRCVFKVERKMVLPREIVTTHQGKFKSEDTVELNIVTTVGLSAENRYVDVNMKFFNAAKDHRMKLTIPTGITENKYFAGEAFYCCERDTDINHATSTWREAEPHEKAMNGIVGKRDKNGDGIAFVSAEGLHECASYPDTLGTLDVTILRAFRKTVSTDGETLGQLNRELEYKFAFATLDSDVSYFDLLKIQDSLAVKEHIVMSATKLGAEIMRPFSNLEVGGKDIATSIIKPAENGKQGEIIVRVFNASAKASKGYIRAAKNITAAELVNLNEELIEAVKPNGNKLEFSLAPWKIATYKLSLDL